MVIIKLSYKYNFLSLKGIVSKMLKKGIVAYVLMLVLLTGCGASPTEVAKDTHSVVEQAFQSEPPEPNQTDTSLQYFLPSDMQVESEGENNLILKKGDQLFILFINPNEDENSEVMYQTTAPKTDTDILNETFKDENRFGYVKVEAIEEKSYEVSVGIGGIKMTTVSDLRHIEDAAEQMMQIVSSVNF